MPSYFVRQPNGLLARFSTVVDHFSDLDMTDAHALDWCRKEGMSESDAAAKVRRGVEDETIYPDEQRCCDGFHRWHESLSTILHVHGTKGLAEFLAEYPTTYGGPVPAAPGIVGGHGEANTDRR